LAVGRRVSEADHSFHVLARSGRNDRDVMGEVVATPSVWIGPASGLEHDPEKWKRACSLERHCMSQTFRWMLNRAVWRLDVTQRPRGMTHDAGWLGGGNEGLDQLDGMLVAQPRRF
jgi:hypothetical protein